MTAPKSLAQYSDVQYVLDEAINHRGGTYRCATHGAAVHWRLRAYSFRALMRKRNAEGSPVPGFDPGTPYDKLILRIPDKGLPNDTCVIIAWATPLGTFEPAGERITERPDTPAPAVFDLDIDIGGEIEALQRKLSSAPKSK